MDTFAHEWTFRDPTTTITYPAGHTEKLPAHIHRAAKKAGVLLQPILETENGDNVSLAAPRPPRRSRRAKE